MTFGAAELGTMTVNVLCFSYGFGILGATDTLASQAYGRDNLKTVGLTLKRS
jgi:Na+-driven multidrug efflux pump